VRTPLAHPMETGCPFLPWEFISKPREKWGFSTERSRRDCPSLNFYSNTLSSSFFLPQSAAACRKARTMGCGFFSVDDSCGWKSVAKKNL
jgi:hypothetical protein